MKKQFSLLPTVFTILFAQFCLSQVNTDLRPAIKSPEANKFEQYLNMPVNLVSGTPQVSIPIYTLNYSGMSLPISLEYDASGVKVESIASSVGQNWSLNVGGTVSRIIKGAPDEGNLYGPQRKSRIQTSGYYLDYGLSNLNNTLNTYSETGQPINRYGEFNIWLNDVFQSYLDAQPDLFYFSTPEGGSKFVFNDHRDVVYLENTDFIIKETFDSNANKFTWNAISPMGIKYSFGANNLIESTSISNVGELIYQYKTNAWFLNEMSNYATNDKITLSYIDNNYSTIINKSPSKITAPCIPILQNGAQCSIGFESSEYGNFAQNPNANDSSSPEIFSGGGGPNLENRLMSKLISKIIAGKTEINFIYSVRDDVAPLLNFTGSEVITAQRLDEIQVIQNGQCIKKFKFNYTTTTATDTPPSGLVRPNVLQKRLVLNNFQESNCDGTITKPYVFNYDPQVLPNKLSYGQDKWGYYNGVLTNYGLVPMNKFNKNPLIYANRAVNFSFAKAGILQKITYPTTGTINFDYEQHLSDVPVDFNYDIDHPIATLADISSTQSTTGTYSTVFTYNAISNETLLLETNMDYNPTNGAGCSSSIDRAASIVDNVTNTVIAQINYKGVLTSKKVLLPIDETLLVNQRQYTLIVQGYGGTNGLTYMCNINRSSVKRIPIIPIYDVGGLRVKKITYKNDNIIVKENNFSYLLPKITSNPVPIYKINYNYLNSLDALQYYPTILGYSNVSYFKNYILNNNANYISGYYYCLSSGIDPLDVNFIGPNITYGQVIETDGNGKTEHNFNPYKSYFELNGFVQPKQIPAEPKFQSLLAGEKISVIQYDQNNNVKKNNGVVYNYNSNYIVTNYPVVGLTINKNEYGCIYYPYTLQGQTKTLKTEIEITRLSGQDVTTTKDYLYRADNKHFQPIQITTTDNTGSQKLITKMYYPNDMGTEPFMAELLAQNKKATPIKIETFRGTTAVADKLSEQRTVYANDLTTGSLLLPKSVYAAKFPNILPTITTPNVGQLEKKVTSDFYDTNGNLLQYTPENGSPVSIIWGYYKTQPIAKIENATYASITSSYITTAQSASDTGTEASLLSALTTLRNSLPATAMATTYSYRPLIGVSTITDPKGLTSYYEYDTFNRLKFIKDQDLNILQRNCYNYKGQVIDCSQIGQVPPPNPPTGLAASSIASTTLTLNWVASTGGTVTNYTVYKNGVLIATLGNVLTYNVTGLTPSTPYSFTVYAKDAAGNTSAVSNTATATTTAGSTDTIAPSTPAITSSSRTTAPSVKINWTGSTDNVAVTGYELWRDVDQTGTFSLIATPTTSPYTDVDIIAGVGYSYSYKMRARDAAGNWSAFSAVKIQVVP